MSNRLAESLNITGRAAAECGVVMRSVKPGEDIGDEAMEITFEVELDDELSCKLRS